MRAVRARDAVEGARATGERHGCTPGYPTYRAPDGVDGCSVPGPGRGSAMVMCSGHPLVDARRTSPPGIAELRSTSQLRGSRPGTCTRLPARAVEVRAQRSMRRRGRRTARLRLVE